MSSPRIVRQRQLDPLPPQFDPLAAVQPHLDCPQTSSDVD